MKTLKYFSFIIIISVIGLVSCNSTGNKNHRDVDASTIGGNSMDSAQNLNRTKFNEQPSAQKNSGYLMQFYASGVYNITASKEALKRSQNDKVNQLAQKLIKNYTELNEQTKKLADQKQFSIPETLTPVNEGYIKVLKKEKAEPFNDDFLRQGIMDQKAVLNMLNEAKESNDKDIIDWANAMLPRIQDIENQTSSLQSALNLK